MKIQRVYLDTSVVGGCFDPEFAQWSLGLIEDFRRGIYRALISEVAETEIRLAPAPVQALLAELLTMNSERLVATENAAMLAELYMKRRVVTRKFLGDAFHIAVATVAEADVLVSWNFKHIVHLDKIRQFNAVNLEMGYKPLQIYSPREVTHHGKV